MTVSAFVLKNKTEPTSTIAKIIEALIKSNLKND